MLYRGWKIITIPDKYGWYEWELHRKGKIWYDPTSMPTEEDCIAQAKHAVDFRILEAGKSRRHAGSRSWFKQHYRSKQKCQ